MTALRTAAALVTSLLLVALTTGAGDAGVRPGSAEGAELVKTGWWWAANDTPLDNTEVAPPQPSAPNVPKGTLPVSAAGGEPEKFTALEFKLEGDGGFVESAVLVLRENTQPGATVNAEGAKILACPVTETFWADGASAAWKARPEYDCDLASAAGERDAKTGLWTFDLTSVASLWTAEGHTGATSVALVEGAEPPESFQVAFDGPAEDGIGYAFALGKAPDLSANLSDGGPVQAGGGSAGLDSGGSLGSDIGAAEIPPAADVPAEQPAVAGPATEPTTPVAAPLAPPAWYSGIPRGGYLLLGLALCLAYLAMLALGPDAQPTAGPERHGVGRALERVRAAGADLSTRRQG
jgi:hypothetical protein